MVAVIVGMTNRNYTDLTAWQRAIDLVQAVYGVSRSFPKHELFTLTSQLRRAAISVPSNIAEGQGRGSRKEFLRFLAIAYGSLRELETLVVIARRLAYLSEHEAAPTLALASETGKIINGLARALRNRA